MTKFSERAQGFPWPFAEGETDFRYSVNVEPARVRRTTATGGWGEHLVDLGGSDYTQLMQQRREVIAAHPERRRVLPGMEMACWDLLLYYLRDMAAAYPESMHLGEEGKNFHWRNDLLGTDQAFTFGQEESLPTDPLTFLASEIPDDLVLLTERDGELFFDAGLVTFAASWSVSFNVGMSMTEIHGPVPRMTAEGMTRRAEIFMRQLQPGQAYRRLNWSTSKHRGERLDTSLETYREWESEIPQLVEEEDWGSLQLRNELQHFVRLPMTGTVAFAIRTYILPLAEIREIPEWRDQLASILRELPEDLATYKGFGDFREEIVDYLAQPADSMG
ncbi:DUF3445 domain-containing protein [Nesterenkonia sp. MY13]|uniref:DUF3445 domain-containing protein n=1 Tax=Nesterenkonia sedimenti TaxID=1463632 RepID=A0A7X8YEP9_9MICC|nr:DUF3445 domain-containing protein [Nesterenkonia sedimenti]NLS10720.1 DUF3445 domain-containing protein [Nesterenkonia sedimenti]